MEQLLAHYGELLAHWQWIQSLSNEQLLAMCAAASIPLWFLVFILKTILIGILRKLGCSSPKLYSRIPTLPWRTVKKVNISISRFFEQFKYGNVATGGFASVTATLCHRHTSSTIMLGLAAIYGFGIYQTVGLALTKHLAIIAGTGSGKTSSVIGMLSEYKGSAFVLDPSSAICQALANKDRKRRWVRLAPYDSETAQLNPFDDVKAAAKRHGSLSVAVKWSYRIGYAFISVDPASRSKYFDETSRGMFIGVFLHVLSSHPEDEHHLGTVRDLIVHGYRIYHDDGTLDTTPEESRQLLNKLMMENPAFDGAIAGTASAYINASKETRGNLDSTLLSKTAILDIPEVRHFFKRTTVPLSDVKTRKDIVMAMDIPLYSLREELQGVARIVQNLLCYTFEDKSIKKNGNALFICDEVQAQGYNSTLETSLPIARSQGLFIVAITQDIEGLRAAYPKTYKAFIGNADAVLWMGTAHPENLRHICTTLGKKTIVTKDKRTGREGYREVNVMEEEQIARFLSPKRGNLIVTVSGGRAMRLKIDPYFKALPVWRYDQDPDHKEALLRRIMRFLLRPFLRNGTRPTQQHAVPASVDTVSDASAMQSVNPVPENTPSNNTVISLEEFRDGK